MIGAIRTTRSIDYATTAHALPLHIENPPLLNNVLRAPSLKALEIKFTKKFQSLLNWEWRNVSSLREHHDISWSISFIIVALSYFRLQSTCQLTFGHALLHCSADIHQWPCCSWMIYNAREPCLRNAACIVMNCRQTSRMPSRDP